MQLSLSTAQPTFAAEPPVIAPMEVTLGALKPMGEPQIREKFKSNLGLRRAAQKKQAEFQFDQEDASFASNSAALQQQVLELNVKKSQMARAKPRAARMEGISVSYRLSHPVTLASRTDEQMVQMAGASVPAEFTHTGAPVLTDFVYIEASARNTSPYVFLSGPSNSYLDGEFVGRGKMQMVACGEEFKAGFGVDPQVQVARELVNKTERIEGGNKVSEFEYKLTVSNYGETTIPLRLEDRIPYSSKSSIQVKLLQTEPELSQDKEYKTEGYKKGLLRWDLQIPAEATNDKAVVVTYKFSVAHDRQMSITGMTKSQ